MMASEDTGQPVLVTYAAPQAFLASSSWKQIHASLLAQLPLRNIHWKARSVLRTIQELDFTLVPLDSVRDEMTSQVPVTILEKPLLNMYILPCEDADLEAYRLVHKKQVKEWLNVVTSRKHQDWLLLHLVKHDPRAGGKLFQLKGSVLERMKADLNTEKRDRVAQITWAPGSEGNATTWAEFTNKIKDGLVYAFDSAVSQREDEVKRSESQRQMPGWNFCTFFILKESLSNSFEGMNLFEEALMYYDELEETFSHVLKEKNLSWFGTLINPHPSDDRSPLFASNKKPYRDLILANNISVFDLRSYLLARRCGLLAKLGWISEAAWRAKSFLVALARPLRDIEEILPKFFIESWTYNSALSAVEQCDQWITAFKAEESKLSNYYAAKGELLELGQIQLNAIGTRVNHLPKSSPFVMGPLRDVSADPSQQIGNPGVLKSISDAEFFYDLYVKITNQAIEMFTKARRQKFVLKLHEYLAALDHHRGRLAAALTTYSSLPAHYEPHMWSSLEFFTLSQALGIHTKVEKAKDAEWILGLLSFLKTSVECPDIGMVMDKNDRTEHIHYLVRMLKTVSPAIEVDMVHADHPAFATRVAGPIKLAESMDGLYLDVIVHNRLPCGMPIDEITIMASGRDSESLLFSSKIEEIPIGKTTLTLFCPASSPGTYILDSCQVSVGRLKLQWLYRKQSQKSSRPMPHDDVLIYVPGDPLALDVQLRRPERIELGRPPSLHAIISTGRNNASRIALKLTAAGINFRIHETTVLQGQVIPDIVDDALVFLDVQAGTDIAFKVPYAENATLRVLKVFVDLSYTTTSQPGMTRVLHTTRALSTTLPFSVNVEDFFRDQSLICKFTVSSMSHQHVRIASIKLEAPENSSTLRVVSCPTPANIMTVRPTQPIHALFRLNCDDGPDSEPLSLVVQYRMLREEVEELIQTSVRKLLDTASVVADERKRSAVVKKLVEALEIDASWVELYELTGELVAPVLDTDDNDDLLESVRKNLEMGQNSPGLDGTWRVMKIPVDVPQIHVVAATRISLEVDEPDKGTLYAGQPVPACLTIHTSFHWGVNKCQQYAMRFDIEELVKDWLISGHKRGGFIARDGETLSVPLTMVALHHGVLPLPKINVSVLHSTGETSMGSYVVPSIDTHEIHGAEKILVLPRGGKSTFVVEMGTV